MTTETDDDSTDHGGAREGAGRPAGTRAVSAAARTRLVNARAAKEEAQAQLAAIELAKARREYAPVSVMAVVLARMTSKIVAKLEAIPGELRLKAPHLTPRDIKIVADVIAKARNEAADTEVDMDDFIEGAT